MLLLVLIVVAICFLASLLPFLFPGALISALGVVLNQTLGGFLMALGVGLGSLVSGGSGQAALTFQGVLVVYLPPLVVILFILRGR